EMGGCRQRLSLGKEELDALLRQRVLRKQPQRRGEPAGGARRREPGGRLAGLAQDLDGSQITFTGRALDVVRACRRRCAPLRKCLRAALVPAYPPSGGCCLVDRSSNERMPEAKASRDVGRPNEIALQELVDSVHRGRLRLGGGGGRPLGLEGIARNRRALEHEACLVREQRELLGQRGGDGGGDADRVG